METDINASKTRQQLNDVAGKMKIIEARLNALTNHQTKSLKLKTVALPKVASQLPDELGYSLLARRADLQAAHWYVESSLSTIDAAKAAFYPDINLMAFLQQDALHLSDLFRHSAQQMGVTAGLTLPIFDSGRLNASAKPESPRCVSGPMACYCKGSGWMPPFNSLVRWAGVTNADDMRLLYLTFIQR